MFEAVFILTAVDAGTRVGRFFLQEMIGRYIWPKFNDKNWLPGLIITSVLFTGSWGYLVYSGDISSIWPRFGISNQLLASFWAAIWLVLYQYLPNGQTLLAVLSVLIMLLMAFVIVGTIRRWIALINMKTLTHDSYGVVCKQVVEE